MENHSSQRLDKSLADNGVNHKSLIRMITPGLNGINNSGF